MDKVEEQIHGLNDLVTDLLAFARPDATRMADVRLEDVARTVVDQTANQHPQVRLRIEGSGAAWADPNLVSHVLVNLVENAAQAMEDAGDVLLRVAPGQILVNDAGPGIPSAHRSEIFKPFFTTRIRGTGLGLSICHKAASAMGGALELASGPLPGAAFLLRLQTARPE